MTKDEFIAEVYELLFGVDAFVDNGEELHVRGFSYREALEELARVDKVYESD